MQTKYIPMRDQCLRWNQNFEKYIYLVEKHIGEVASLLESYIAEEGLLLQNLRETYNKLPLESKIRLYISPNVADVLYAVRANPKAKEVSILLQQLEDFIAAEIVLANVSYIHPRELRWTSLADHSFNSEDKPLKTKNNIPVEYNGHIHNQGIQTICPLDYEEAKAIVEKIDLALEIIEKVSPETYSLINTFTNIIHLRKDPGHPNYASWSTHIGIGKIVACNFHYVGDELEQVIDFLIHESTHNFLHLVEEDCGTFLKASSFEQEWLMEKIVPSPWSGVKIDVGSYTHAIVVWYGLANFWDKARKNLEFNEETLPRKKCSEMFEQACEGFVNSKSIYFAVEEKFEYLEADYINFSRHFQPEIVALAQ